MENYIDSIKKSFGIFYRMIKKGQINDNEILKSLKELKKIYTSHLSVIETLTNKYLTKMNSEIFNGEQNLLHFAYRNNIGELKWGTPTITKIENVKELTNVNGVQIDRIIIPVVHSLIDIKPCMYWYNGDSNTSEGIYISISEDQYLKVPLPDLLDGTIGSNRCGSIKCKYGDEKLCVENRKSKAQKYNNIQIRGCNFAHIGDRYTKIGMQYRCPSCPSFGRHRSLHSDIRMVQYEDIKILLMYALSDLLLSVIWFQNFDNSTLPNTSSDLDICN